MAAFGGGYTCVTCGQWVAEGSTHYCSGVGYKWATPSVPLIPPIDLDRITNLLERIAVALEELVEIRPDLPQEESPFTKPEMQEVDPGVDWLGRKETVLGYCVHGVNLDRDLCPEGCRK